MGKADGLLLDLGFSSEQLEGSGRGFSFAAAHADEPLLMTYDDSRIAGFAAPAGRFRRRRSRTSSLNSAASGISRRIAKAIKERGRRRPIATAGELAETVRTAVPGGYEHGRIDPATRTFQALRIYANGELENLKAYLRAAWG